MFTIRVRVRAFGPTGKRGRSRTVVALIDPERLDTAIDAELVRSLEAVVIRGRRRADDRTCLAIDASPPTTGTATILAAIEDLGRLREREGRPIRVRLGRDALRFVRGPMPRLRVLDGDGREVTPAELDAINRRALAGLRRRSRELAAFVGGEDMGDIPSVWRARITPAEAKSLREWARSRGGYPGATRHG